MVRSTITIRGKRRMIDRDSKGRITNMIDFGRSAAAKRVAARRKLSAKANLAIRKNIAARRRAASKFGRRR